MSQQTTEYRQLILYTFTTHGEQLSFKRAEEFAVSRSEGSDIEAPASGDRVLTLSAERSSPCTVTGAIRVVLRFALNPVVGACIVMRLHSRDRSIVICTSPMRSIIVAPGGPKAWDQLNVVRAIARCSVTHPNVSDPRQLAMQYLPWFVGLAAAVVPQVFDGMLPPQAHAQLWHISATVRSHNDTCVNGPNGRQERWLRRRRLLLRSEFPFKSSYST